LKQRRLYLSASTSNNLSNSTTTNYYSMSSSSHTVYRFNFDSNHNVINAQGLKPLSLIPFHPRPNTALMLFRLSTDIKGSIAQTIDTSKKKGIRAIWSQKIARIVFYSTSETWVTLRCAGRRELRKVEKLFLFLLEDVEADVLIDYLVEIIETKGLD